MSSNPIYGIAYEPARLRMIDEQTFDAMIDTTSPHFERWLLILSLFITKDNKWMTAEEFDIDHKLRKFNARKMMGQLRNELIIYALVSGRTGWYQSGGD